MMRRDFQMPQEDVEMLDSNDFQWETVKEGKKQWLIVRGCQIPKGYNQSVADVALLIESNYPSTEIDMAYFYPAVLPANGKTPKNCGSKQPIEGKQWQRWSRHRKNPQLDWIEGVHNVVTHLNQVRGWLEREVV